MISLLLLLSTCSLVYGSPFLPDDENGWWSTLTSNFSLWRSDEGESPSESSKDNDEEINSSVKLAELFPTLKEQLESSDEKEREEAREFIKGMDTQIKEKKRYANIFWKGVKTIIDMGRLESNERRSNEKEVGILCRIISIIINFFKRMLGMKTDDDDDNHKFKKSRSTDSKKEGNDHSDQHSTSQHSTLSDRKAGLKDDLDHFTENTEEFIEGDEPSNTGSHTKANNKPQHFDPKAGTKGKLDVIDPHKPVVEFLHDEEKKPDDAANSKKD
ncbi:uncharacterized protein LOC135844004 [Planococcus citri]|uniref:uncharacterized protein LOC135844004 n=1 Tax=Planococcus citri TaxID=170843 RepID=UPI0031F9CF37